MFIHINGENAPRIARMRHNTKKEAVEQAMGGSHATMEFGSRYEVTSDSIMEFMLTHMVSDGDTDYESTAAAMRAEIEKQITAKPAPKPRAKAVKSAGARSSGGRAKTDIDLQKTLVQLHDTNGKLTFMLVDPEPSTPKVIAAGAGSLPEMISKLDNSKVRRQCVFSTG